MSARKNLLDGYRIGGDLIDRIIVQAEKQSAGDIGSEGDNVPVPATPTQLAAAGATSTTPGNTADDALPGVLHETTVPAPAPGKTVHDKPGVVVNFPGTEPKEPLPEYPIEHRKDGLFEVFTIGDIEYRIGGIKPLFVTNLRVNIRARMGERSYFDSLDLYLARSRTAFALSLERNLGSEPARAERDMLRIIAFLETERDKALHNTGKSEPAAMTEAERQAGMNLLTDPNLFTRIVDDLSTLGYVGEYYNKQLLYLCAISRKRNKPLSVIILSQSASGKSYAVDCVRQLVPPGDVIAITSLSDQALNYLTDLEHKFLILGEAVHSEAVEHQIREMLSGQELSRLVVEKDPDSGRMESRMIKRPVIVSSVMGSTAGNVNPENASRCFVIHADESKEQTERIHEYQRKKKCSDRLLIESKETQEIISAHRAAQALLKNIAVVNDYAPRIDFPTALMRSRRDHQRFLDLIDAVCFLRQYQKQEEVKDGVRFIRCDLTDYEIAYRIMVEGVLSSTLEELPRGARLLYEQIRDWVRVTAKARKITAGDLRFTQRQIRDATGLGHTWVKAMIRFLVDYEYVEQVGGGGQRSKAWYSLRSDEEIRRADLSMIPSPADLAVAQKTGRTGQTGSVTQSEKLNPYNTKN